MTIDGWDGEERIHFFRGNGRKPCVMTQPPHSLCNEACVTTSTHSRYGLAPTLYKLSHQIFGVAESVSSPSMTPPIPRRVHVASVYSSDLLYMQIYLQSVLTNLIRTPSFCVSSPAEISILFVSLSPLGPPIFSLGFFWCLAIGLRSVIVTTEFAVLYVGMSFDFIFLFFVWGRCISGWKNIYGACFIGQISEYSIENRNSKVELPVDLYISFFYYFGTNSYRLYRDAKKKKVRF